MDNTNLTHHEAGRAEGSDELFSDAFMRENTQFETWDQFKRRLAATPRDERDAFVLKTTRFSSFNEMERVALGLLELSHHPASLAGTAGRWAARWRW